MKNWEKVLLLLTIIVVCCMITSYFLFEGYTQEDRDSDRQKIENVGIILRELINSGVLPSKIPLSKENKEKIIDGASAFVRVVKNDAIMFFNQKSESLEASASSMVNEILNKYTADIDISEPQ